MQLVSELRRRNVFRMGALYLVGAWVVLQVCDVLIGLFELPDGTLKTVGIVLLIGFPLAIIFSWIYELTPEGLQKDVGTDQAPEYRGAVRGRMNNAIVIGLLVAVGFLLVDRFMEPEPMVVEASSIDPTGDPITAPRIPDVGLAVLPFENMSADEANEFFTRGLHEDVISQLSKIPDLRVLSRTSVMPYVNSDISIPKIGELLNASHILEGSVRREGDTVRVTLQLIKASADEHLWAKNYDKTVENSFELQSEVAREVASELEVTLTQEELVRLTPGTNNPLAYKAFNRVREGATRWTVEDRAEIERWLKEAIMLDPEFADAYAELASYYVVMQGRGTDWSELRKLALENAEKALALDPKHLKATTVMARIGLHDGDMEAAEEWSLKAVALKPDDHEAREAYTRILQRQRRFDEWAEQQRIMVAYQPDSEMEHFYLVQALAGAARIEEAERELAAADEKFPWEEGERFRMQVEFEIALAADDPFRALTSLYLALRYADTPDSWQPNMSRILVNIGEVDAGVRWSRHFAKLGEGRGLNLQYGQLMAGLQMLGRYEEALEVIEQLPQLSDAGRLTYQLRSYGPKLAMEEPDPSVVARVMDLCDEFEASVRNAEGAIVLEDQHIDHAARCFVFSRLTPKPRPELGEALVLYELEFPLVQLVAAYAAAGEVDRAIEELSRFAQPFDGHPAEDPNNQLYRLAYWPIEEDPKGIFNGLAEHPEYQRIVSAYRNKYADARERIVAEAPYLLDPALPYYIDTPGLGVAILPTSNESSFPVFDNYAKNYRLELYTRLSEMPGLRVPSPEAVDHALETSEDLAAAVDQLGVSHAFRLVVLPNDADSVRDSLSLLDPRKDEVVWEIGNERLVEQWTEEANERLAWLAHAHERSFAQALRAALYEREQEILGEGDTLVLNAH